MRSKSPLRRSLGRGVSNATRDSVFPMPVLVLVRSGWILIREPNVSSTFTLSQLKSASLCVSIYYDLSYPADQRQRGQNSTMEPETRTNSFATNPKQQRLHRLLRQRESRRRLRLLVGDPAIGEM